MTRDEFEQRYAVKSGVTVEQLHGMGLFGAPCDCGWVECEGWQMVHKGAHESGGPV